MVKTVHPADIESELERIWKSFQGTNKMRACLFNLIIYTQKTQRHLYLNLIVKKIIKKFPSRIILITYDNSYKKHNLHTSVSVLSAEVGENVIACDVIEINLCNKHHPHLPFVIFPHILPDLPIYLIYVDDPSQRNPIARQLGLLAHRIIFDSEVASNLFHFVQSVRKYKKECHADVADLNWTRTEEWRQLFANIFYSPEDLSQLNEATQITIYYNSIQLKHIRHSNIQAIYLQAWIAGQLGWKLTTLSQNTHAQNFSYATQRISTQISLYPSSVQELPPGSILAIEITTKSKHHYSFKRSDTNSNYIIINRSSPNYCLLPTCYVLDGDITGRVLIKEICHQGTSTHYTKTLHMVKKMQKELSEIDDE